MKAENASYVRVGHFILLGYLPIAFSGAYKVVDFLVAFPVMEAGHNLSKAHLEKVCKGRVMHRESV